MGKYYSIGPSYEERWFWGRVITPLDCAELGRTGMRGFQNIVRIDIVEGKESGDFLWNGFVLLVCSPKVLSIWEKYRAFETYRISVLGLGDIRYTGVVFTGRGGPFDPVRSKAVFSEESDESGRRVVLKQDGLYFDESYWDRSDLFTIDDFPRLPILTARVVEEMKKTGVTNCRYTPLEDYGNLQKLIASTQREKPDEHSNS